MEEAHVMDAKVRDVMTPGPIGVDYHQSIGDAARAMRDWGIGAVLVTDGENLCGLVTARDLVVRGLAADNGADALVGPLSSAELIGVEADADAGEAARLMRQHDVRRLPVLEGGEVTGVISMNDLALYWELSAAVDELGAKVSLPAA
jgi:CBS domain-containing protein